LPYEVSFSIPFPCCSRYSCVALCDHMYIHHKKCQGYREDVGKKDEKKGGKDSQLILRLEKKDRDEFVALCKKMDTSAAREVRRFIREFIKENG